MHILKRKYMPAYLHTYMHKYIHTSIHAYIHTYRKQTYIHTQTHSDKNRYTNACIHARFNLAGYIFSNNCNFGTLSMYLNM